MKKIVFTLILCAAAAAIFAKSEYKREITKTFSTGANPSLAIESKYGFIKVIEGTDNQIMFRIEIIGKGSSDKLAKEYAESVTVDFSQQGDNVKAVTTFKNLSGANIERTVNYTVVAPKRVKLALEHKYGNITLGDLTEPLNVDLKYGEITVDKTDRANIDIAYGKVNIASGRQLAIDSKYSELTLGETGALNIDSKYDKINIRSANEIALETGYTDVNIGKLGKNLAVEVSYGKLDVSEISTAFEKIDVRAKYTDVRLALNSSHSFRANLAVKYGNINTDLKFNNVSVGDKKDKGINGTAGSNPNPTAIVDVSATYGNITLK